MPQEFQVLRCFNCEKFQVHQTKKSKTWICKVCGEKQSYLRIYFTGSARQCRFIVQENNFTAGEKRTIKILAESPNSISVSDVTAEEFDDQHEFFNYSSKRLKSEIERSTSIENFQAESTCLTRDGEAFFNESCETREYYYTNDMAEKLSENLDSQQKQQVTGFNTINEEFLSNIVPGIDTCNEEDSHSKREMPKVKPHFVKNSGFQKILKAAERFS